MVTPHASVASAPAGPPIPATEIRIVSPDNHAKELPDGEQGLIMSSG